MAWLGSRGSVSHKAADALARITLVSGIGCGVVSGLDRLEKVPCVQACGDSARATGGDAATTTSRDGASHVEGAPDASLLVDAFAEPDAPTSRDAPPADVSSNMEATVSADAPPAGDSSEAETLTPPDASMSLEASMNDSSEPGDGSYDAGLCGIGTTLSRTLWASNLGTTASDNPGSIGNLFDGSLTTRWSTGRLQTTDPAEWLEIDLGCLQSFSQVVLQNGADPDNVNDYPRGYTFEVSTDNANWTQVASGTGSTITTIAFASVMARYIRVNQTATSTTNWWSIDELNVYP